MRLDGERVAPERGAESDAGRGRIPLTGDVAPRGIGTCRGNAPPGGDIEVDRGETEPRARTSAMDDPAAQLIATTQKFVRLVEATLDKRFAYAARGDHRPTSDQRVHGHDVETVFGAVRAEKVEVTGATVSHGEPGTGHEAAHGEHVDQRITEAFGRPRAELVGELQEHDSLHPALLQQLQPIVDRGEPGRTATRIDDAPRMGV